MKVIGYLLQKEFKQIFRNKAMLPIILVIPVVQLLVLSFAVDYEIKNLNLWLVDRDNSEFSRLLSDKFTAGNYFQVSGVSDNHQEAIEAIELRNADLILEIPPSFERNLIRYGNGELLVMADAIDGTKAGLATQYASAIIGNFNRSVNRDYAIQLNKMVFPKLKSLKMESKFLYNPSMNYQAYMVPGILVILITMIGAFLSSMNIVREKELGTIEQLNVTPIKKYQFIIGKMLPFWILGLVEFSIGLIAAELVFDIPFVGSLVVIYAFAAVYLFLVLGFGLLISTLTDTQQQAMFISWFFLVIFILMGGLFTPVENMPVWAQNITLFNPVRYFVEVARAVMLKGAHFDDLTMHFIIISAFAVVLNILAVLRYKKTV